MRDPSDLRLNSWVPRYPLCRGGKVLGMAAPNLQRLVFDCFLVFFVFGVVHFFVSFVSLKFKIVFPGLAPRPGLGVCVPALGKKTKLRRTAWNEGGEKS